ncbi:hypothetical protein IMCC3317_24690 [Kordia antarctica]|uniref:Uncharacterized protein n=1 Tax=Kordia antarctica TaxID=1218801 RepID=A0A7L4ZKQ1_9FLAO|nr:hypothetical protein IMCC3317_24690 [Kordia antarctica]
MWEEKRDSRLCGKTKLQFLKGFIIGFLTAIVFIVLFVVVALYVTYI